MYPTNESTGHAGHRKIEIVSDTYAFEAVEGRRTKYWSLLLIQDKPKKLDNYSNLRKIM